MSRGLTTAQKAAITSKTLRPAVFVFLDFLSAPVRVWSGAGSFSWGGNTYTGVGTLGGVSQVEETGNPTANGITLTLTGVPSDMLYIAMNRTEYRGRRVFVWNALFAVADGAPTLIDTPILAFAGRMDVMTPNDTGKGESSISLTCENRLIDLGRARECRRTDADQRRAHPTDGSFRYVAGLQDKQFQWGLK